MSGVVDLGTVITSHQDISGKVDKETGKGLSTNDFTSTYKDNVDSNTSARHSHSNKTVLDGISSTDITNWNGKGTYSKPSSGIPKTDLASAVQTSLDKADGSVQLSGGSSQQTISLTSGTGTTPLGIKSRSGSSYVSFTGTSGWLGSFGVSSDKKPIFYNGTGYTLAYTSDIPDVSGKENSSNKVTSISSSSTDTQYPSAKCVYDMIGDVETILTTLTTGSGV